MTTCPDGITHQPGDLCPDGVTSPHGPHHALRAGATDACTGVGQQTGCPRCSVALDRSTHRACACATPCTASQCLATTTPPPLDDDELRTATLDALTAAGIDPGDCDANRLEDIRDSLLELLREAAAVKRAQTLTPLGYASGVLGRHVDPGEPGFGDGWLVGIEGAAEINTHPLPVDAGLYDPRTAGWLAGILAGRYAAQYNWATATELAFP